MTVFKNLNLIIPQGKVTAFVGESGSGKTTIIILQKLYILDEGRVLIGDINLEHIDSRNLRNAASVIPQEVDLFAGNGIDNIVVGKFEPVMEKIVSICKKLGIIEFIEDLPHGFQTYLLR